MIYNDHLYAIEDQIEQLISSIKNSQLFRSYCYNKKAMYQDQEVLGLIDSFVHKKTDFEKIAAYGTFAPGYKEQQRALRKAKRALDLNPQVGEFRTVKTSCKSCLMRSQCRLLIVSQRKSKWTLEVLFFNRNQHVEEVGHARGDERNV